MSFSVGSRLRPYQITAQIGAGVPLLTHQLKRGWMAPQLMKFHKSPAQSGHHLCCDVPLRSPRFAGEYSLRNGIN